jgi:hypothetical protein
MRRLRPQPVAGKQDLIVPGLCAAPSHREELTMREIETERLMLRDFVVADWDAFRAI